MPDRIKTITDKNIYELILNKYFGKDNVYLKTKDEHIKIEFIGYSDNNAVFKVPSIKNISDNNVVLANYGDNIIKAEMSFTDKKEDKTFLFSVNELQIIQQSRKEERKSLKWRNTGNKNIIFATNIISDSIIQNSLSLDLKRINRIRESVMEEMSKAFDSVKVFFCNEGTGNIRMNLFFRNKDPIFIPDINSQNSQNDAKDIEKINIYKDLIYMKDYYLQGKKELISEIAVPICYKRKLPYGYVQVNSKSPLTDTIVPVIDRCALVIDNMMNKEKVFPHTEERVIVSNISRNGIGIVFRESKYLRYFKKYNYIYFNLLLPDLRVIPIIANVRNISHSENKIIMIGCSIEEISESDEMKYNEYIDSLLSAEKKTDHK